MVWLLSSGMLVVYVVVLEMVLVCVVLEVVLVAAVHSFQLHFAK